MPGPYPLPTPRGGREDPTVHFSPPRRSLPGKNANDLRQQRKSTSEDIIFVSGSAETSPEESQCCPQLYSAWTTYKSVLCYILSCSRCSQKDPEEYTPCTVEISEGGSHNGHPAGSPPQRRDGERNKKVGLGNSFSYPDLKLKGVPVFNKACTTTTDIEASKDPPAPPPVPRNSAGEDYLPRDSDPDLSRWSGSMSSQEIDVLIWQKLTELFSFHQIDELARCTSETVFLEKSSQITELISSLTQDYQLEEQDAECRLVRGIIRISTRKTRTRKSNSRGGQQQNSRSGGKAPDSGNESMQESGLTSQDDLDVKISEETSYDVLARNMRKYSSPGSSFLKDDSLQDTETDSSGTPLLKVSC
ncbi:keratinocyte differentiation factor 1 isoform X2 [Pelobates fuscus]